jgi:phosphatidate cytidylyltransferase
MLLRRIVIALFGAPLFIAATIYGNYYLLSLIAVVAAMAVYELFGLFSMPMRGAGNALAMVWYLAIVAAAFQAWSLLPVILPTGFFVLAGLFIWQQGENELRDLFVRLLVPVYPLAGLFSFYYMRHNDALGELGLTYSVVFLLSLWSFDTFAYAGGSWLGKHKLLARVSPNKSVEGLLFGSAGSLLVWLVSLAYSIPPDLAIFSAVVVSVFATLGDFFESRLKRILGRKDASRLLPGHGGVLDRFDSFLFSSPALLIMVQLWY